MTVVKVGGSLFDHPGLLPGLCKWRAGIEGRLLFIPGGGAVVDAVRNWQQIHQFDDQVAHRMAIQGMAVAGEFLKTVPDCDVFDSREALNEKELPSSWAVTSDSIAVWVAKRTRAARLILLKSIDVPAGTPWSDAAANGWVDDFFPTAVSRWDGPVEVVNFRCWFAGNGVGK